MIQVQSLLTLFADQNSMADACTVCLDTATMVMISAVCYLMQRAGAYVEDSTWLS